MNDRVIPEGIVWKYIFEISHAPHYVIQHGNGSFMGIYAPPESVERDTAVPFGLEQEKVLHQRDMSHVTVTELPREQTPWADGTYLEGFHAD